MAPFAASQLALRNSFSFSHVAFSIAYLFLWTIFPTSHVGSFPSARHFPPNFIRHLRQSGISSIWLQSTLKLQSGKSIGSGQVGGGCCWVKAGCQNKKNIATEMISLAITEGSYFLGVSVAPTMHLAVTSLASESNFSISNFFCALSCLVSSARKLMVSNIERRLVFSAA
jgi:hypothetical protein